LTGRQAGTTHALRRVYLLILVGGAVLWAAPFIWVDRAFAAEREPIRLEDARFPLGHRLTGGAWMPVLLVVANGTDAPQRVAVQLGLPLGPSGGAEASYLKTVVLPPHARQEVHLHAFADIGREGLLNYFREPETGEIARRELKAEFPDGTRIVHRPYRLVNPFRRKARLLAGEQAAEQLSQTEVVAGVSHPDGLNVLLVDRADAPPERDVTLRRDGHEFVLGEVPPQEEHATAFGLRNRPTEDQLGGVQVAPGSIRTGELPRLWASYNGIHALVLASPRDRFGHFGLDPMQQRSLLEWVRSGGRLVVLPSADPQTYGHPLWTKLLPVDLLAARREAGGEVLPSRYGGTWTRPEGLLPVRAEGVARADARVLIEGPGGHAWVARRRVGAGQVYFSCLTGGATSAWPQNLALWAEVLRPHPGTLPGARTELASHAPTLMQGVLGVEAPNRFFIVGLLVGYCVLTTVLLVSYRRKGRAERAWPLACGLALACLLVAVGQSRLTGGRTGLVQGEISVSEIGAGNRSASSDSFVGVYSPGGFVADAQFLRRDTLATAFAPRDGQGLGLRSLTVREGERFSFQGLRVNEREPFLCRAMSLGTYGEGVALDLRYDEKGLAGSVHNRTGTDLDDAALYVNRCVLPIGSIPAGKRIELADRPTHPEMAQERGGHGAGSSAQTRRRILALVRRLDDSLTARNDQDRVYRWPAALYAWTQEPRAPVRFGEERPEQRALHLFSVAADGVVLEPGRTVRAPAGTCGLRFNGAASARHFGVPGRSHIRPGARRGQREEETASRAPPGWRSGTGVTSIEVDFLRPDGWDEVALKKAWVHLDIEAGGLEPVVSVKIDPEATRRRGWRRLEFDDEDRAAITDFGQLVRPDGGLPPLRLSLRRARGARSAGGLVEAAWTLRVFDMELEGVVRGGAKTEEGAR
jgi:hypothetical protein